MGLAPLMTTPPAATAAAPANVTGYTDAPLGVLAHSIPHVAYRAEMSTGTLRKRMKEGTCAYLVITAYRHQILHDDAALMIDPGLHDDDALMIDPGHHDGDGRDTIRDAFSRRVTIKASELAHALGVSHRMISRLCAMGPECGGIKSYQHKRGCARRLRVEDVRAWLLSIRVPARWEG